MSRRMIARTVCLAGLLAFGVLAAGSTAGAVQATAEVSPADAAPFIGEWTLNLQGPNGPGAFDLTVKTEKEKVVAEITGGTGTRQPIADIKKNGQSLALSYSFLYESNPVDAVVQLTPAPEAKMTAEISFAGGAYVMNGTAIRKEKGK